MPIGYYKRVVTIPDQVNGGKVPLQCKMPRGTEYWQTLKNLPQRR